MVSANAGKRDSARMRIRQYVMDALYAHAGEVYRFPSNEDIAQQLGVARSTVQLEMKSLIRDGFLESRPGIGTFAGPPPSMPSVPLVGLLNGDGKIVYESSYNFSLKSHIGMELAKIPTIIQEIRLANERENDLYAELLGTGCRAFVAVAPPEMLLPPLRRLAEKVPVVVVDRTVPGLTSIELERTRKGEVLGRALLAEGRKNPYFIQGERYRRTTFEGCRKAFAAAGIELPLSSFALNRDVESLEALLEEGFRPDAMIASFETTAAVVELLRRYGIDLERECRLATFMSKPPIPEPVMRFEFPYRRFGEIAAAEIQKRLANPELPPEQIVFDCEYQFITQ